MPDDSPPAAVTEGQPGGPDREIVGQSYERYAARIEAFARGLLGDAQLAQDVVQTVYRKRIDQPPGGDNEEAWLFTVARNECLSILRRRQVRSRYQPPLKSAPAADLGAVASETSEWLTRALDRLSDQDRDLIRRRFFDRESYETIATDRGTIPSTLSTQVHRLLKRLRKELPEELRPD